MIPYDLAKIYQRFERNLCLLLQICRQLKLWHYSNTAKYMQRTLRRGASNIVTLPVCTFQIKAAGLSETLVFIYHTKWHLIMTNNYFLRAVRVADLSISKICSLLHLLRTKEIRTVTCTCNYKL